MALRAFLLASSIAAGAARIASKERVAANCSLAPGEDRSPILITLTVVSTPPVLTEQFFVNFYDFPDELVVSWASGSSEATVEYGTTPSLGSTATGNSTRYTFHLNYTSPYIHHAVLSGLATKTTYFYRVGGADCGFSSVFSVTTHPGVGAGVVPLKFAIIGDLGQTNNSNATLAHIAASPDAFTGVIIWGGARVVRSRGGG